MKGSPSSYPIFSCSSAARGNTQHTQQMRQHDVRRMSSWMSHQRRVQARTIEFPQRSHSSCFHHISCVLSFGRRSAIFLCPALPAQQLSHAVYRAASTLVLFATWGVATSLNVTYSCWSLQLSLNKSTSSDSGRQQIKVPQSSFTMDRKKGGELALLLSN